MSSPRLLLALWVIQPFIQAGIATIFLRRKLHKQFPAFFNYLVAQIAIFFAQLPVFLYGERWFHGWVLFAAYWAAAAVTLVLTFRIIHEIFLDIFRPFHALQDLGSALFKWAAIITILVSAALVAVSPSWQDPLQTSFLVVQRCVRVVQCGLVIFMLAFCKHLGVHWRRLSFGIALGFGTIAASELLTLALFSGGRLAGQVTQYTLLWGNIVGLLIWMNYGLVNRSRDMVPVLVPQRWDEALMEIQPAPSEAAEDSLIPMFEHMVDQALSKSHETNA